VATSSIPSTPGATPNATPLIRAVGLFQATALNVNNMVGIGPFITLPLIVGSMGGPQAMLCYIVGAIVAVCDGQVWAELSSRLPASGGTYLFVRESYGPRWGLLMSFLFIWQVSFQGPLSFAGGCIGFINYMSYLVPIHGIWMKIGPMAVGLFVVFLLYRRITVIGRMAAVFAMGAILALVATIVAGFWNFHWSLLTDLPADAFTMTSKFWYGLGDATRRGIYTFLGYYNVCFIGDEVKEPSKTIPRSIVLAVALVTVLYLAMNSAILGSMPWRDILPKAGSDSYRYTAALVAERAFGKTAAGGLVLLVLWAAIASLFALMLANSRVLYAAARDGQFFSFFARVHPADKFPYVSLLALGAVAAAFTLLSLDTVIQSLVIIRSLVQFMGQNVGLYMLRRNRPDLPMPFKMWFYPIPGLIALAGWLFIFVTSRKFMLLGGAFLLSGVIAFLIHQWMRREWPFLKPAA
jgi:basic amino acid/polyamine antiporter, APA family